MDVLKAYFDMCKEKIVPLGFRRINQTHARIVNDVLQTLRFQRFTNGYTCTVEFGILPLCEVPWHPDITIYNLKQTEEWESYEDYIGWLYDRHSPDSVNACVQEIAGFMDRQLLPLFEKADCCETALPALKELDVLLHDVRQSHFEKRGEKDEARVDWRFTSLFSTEKYFMALKSGKYEYANEVAKVLIHRLRPEDQLEYQSLLDLANEGKVTQLEEILYEREQRALSKMQKFRLTPIK